MHPTALFNCKLFFDKYADQFSTKKLKVLEIGSQDVNGSLRACAPKNTEYLGVDFVEGKGVDLVLTDPYSLPFEDEEFDIVLSSSCFEHSEMFWLVFTEILRVLKPNGLFYLNVPSNGAYHRYPVDCWRFYPDSGSALVTWGVRSGYRPCLLESYVCDQSEDIWNDYVAVFLKDKNFLSEHKSRILDNFISYRNGYVHGDINIRNQSLHNEDLLKLNMIKNIIDNKIRP